MFSLLTAGGEGEYGHPGGGTVVHERIVFFGSKLYLFEGLTPTAAAKHPAYDKVAGDLQDPLTPLSR